MVLVPLQNLPTSADGFDLHVGITEQIDDRFTLFRITTSDENFTGRST